MAVIIAVIIAVLGWIITHALTIRAQNKNFINQVINHARIQITEAIRDYQDWLNKVHVKISAASFDVVLEEQGVSVDWWKKIAEFREELLTDRSSSRWILRLEEYEIIFPETAECRRDLLDRQRQIRKYLGLFLKELLSGSIDPAALQKRKKATEKAEEDSEIVLDQLALMEDLRIYLQNRCLSSFTGNKVPERNPEDLSLPRLVKDENGNLLIAVTPKKIEGSRN
jgi:hypothetical protein